ncbi:16511_t:CDS:2 [Cetraspora pellucida]|uniref:16511_t:CDS:1 n=1 Tax=Cetraspora pellucida TaxID=1433469 RepID=A0ACA9LJB2_9GLOM|nr:16511_t:CDS:2 [Cetraspora pellucida]
MNDKGKRKASDKLEVQKQNQKKSRNITSPPSSWLKIWEWLEYLETDGTLLMFCKLCKTAKFDNAFTRGTNIFKKDIVKRHDEKDQKHQRAKQQFSTLALHQLNDNDMKIIQQMKCVYFVAKKHLSFNIYPDLYSLVANRNNIALNPQILKIPALSLQESSESSEYKNYGTYLNSVAARNFAIAIVHIIEQKLINEIKLAENWSIMIDESNSIDEKHLVIATQYMTLNVPVIRYIGVIKLEDCRSEYIFEKLKNFISNKELDIKNIAHFGSDGASTMIGLKNGVSTRFKDLNPYMTSVHCIAHRLHLAGQDAAKEVPYFKEYESICKSLYGYFSGSYKRMLKLKMIQETNDEPQLCLLNIINTRWLSMSNTVHNLHQILSSVKDALNYDFITAEKATISAITTQFIGYNNISPTYGIHLSTYMAENSISPEQLPPSMCEFAAALIQSLKSRFPDTNLYKAMKIFELRLLPYRECDLSNYRNAEIEILGNFYGNDRKSSNGKIISALIDKQELKQEWGIVKEMIKSIRNFNYIDGWHFIFSSKLYFCTEFPNISLLVKLTLIIPFSNAHVERIFSQHKLAKSKMRSHMNVDTINLLLMIHENAPDNIDLFDWKSTYYFWKEQQARCIN